MSSVAIYMEGGGDGPATKATLRQEMEVFLAPLKDAARARSWRWKLVCCGGRDEAYAAFTRNLRTRESTVAALLVDAEAPVAASSCAHLLEHDGWELRGVTPDLVHLMVQTMEAWLAADPETLATYYGQHFRANRLPRVANLETVAKADLASALEQATRATQKGVYRKIRHASDLLQRLDRDKVRRRCPNCARLFYEFGAVIASGGPPVA